MKTLLFAACIMAASLLSSCKQDMQSATGPNTFLPLNSGSSPAYPAVTYNLNGGIAVMDSTGANQKTVLTPSGTASINAPTWSPSGGSITYHEATGGSSSIDEVKAMDISVNSHGVPVSSNVRTIYAPSSPDTAFFTFPTWSSTSSVGEIAFIRRYGGYRLGLAQLCVVSQSGGTPTVLASFRKLASNGMVVGHFSCPTWSPDDSKIALVREDTVGHNTIMIFNSSTGAAEDSIPFSSTTPECLEWSRSGSNELLFQLVSGSSSYIYYCAPSTGSTPTTNSVVGYNPTWSPNNSTVMYLTMASTAYALKKLQSYTTTTSTLQSSAFYGTALNWKR